MEISPEHRKGITEGLAAMAITIAQMNRSQQDAWAQVLQMLVHLRIGEADAAQVLREAAQSIAAFPQPPNEPAHRLERGRRVREMLGVPEPSEEIASYLRGREWLENLAARLEGLTDGE